MQGKDNQTGNNSFDPNGGRTPPLSPRSSHITEKEKEKLNKIMDEYITSNYNENLKAFIKASNQTNIQTLAIELVGIIKQFDISVLGTTKEKKEELINILLSLNAAYNNVEMEKRDREIFNTMCQELIEKIENEKNETNRKKIEEYISPEIESSFKAMINGIKNDGPMLWNAVRELKEELAYSGNSTNQDALLFDEREKYFKKAESSLNNAIEKAIQIKLVNLNKLKNELEKLKSNDNSSQNELKKLNEKFEKLKSEVDVDHEEMLILKDVGKQSALYVNIQKNKLDEIEKLVQSKVNEKNGELDTEIENIKKQNLSLNKEMDNLEESLNEKINSFLNNQTYKKLFDVIGGGRVFKEKEKIPEAVETVWDMIPIISWFFKESYKARVEEAKKIYPVLVELDGIAAAFKNKNYDFDVSQDNPFKGEIEKLKGIENQIKDNANKIAGFENEKREYKAKLESGFEAVKKEIEKLKPEEEISQDNSNNNSPNSSPSLGRRSN